MIRVRDALILSYTKLKTRKIRTGITVGISGLLFGLLVAVVIVVNGVEHSIDSFSQEGLGKRYITTAHDSSFFYDGRENLYQNKEVIARAKVIYKELIEEKRKEAARLKIEYNSDMELQPVRKDGDVEWLDPSSPAGLQAVKEYDAKHPRKDTLTSIKEKLAPFHPSQYYTADMAVPSDGRLQTMKDGKEKLVEEKTNQNQYANFNPYEEAEDPAATGLQIMDGQLTSPFILKNSTWKPAEKTIPVIVTYNSAEKFLGMKKLKTDATAKEKLARISEVREKAGSITFSVCYRNSSSQSLIQTVLATQKEIDKNRNNKEYQKPSLIYGLPDTTTCGEVPVISDTRAAAEKTYDQNQQLFDKKFNDYVDLMQVKLQFRVVGLSPGPTGGSLGMMADIVSSLLNSSLGGAWVIPRDLYEKLPDENQHRDVLQQTNKNRTSLDVAMDKQYYVEFANASDARQAIKKYTCGFTGCTEGSLFLMQFGSGSITLAEAKEGFSRVLMIAALIVAAIAMLIMAGTIGRMIADGRRETAVFRAIGAKRSDISMIYIVYTVLLSLRVVIFGLILGIAVALVADYYGSPDATAGAQLMFGSSDLNRQFHLYGFTSIELLYIAGLIFLTGLISMIIPLIRNVRRNPIRDMRDE